MNLPLPDVDSLRSQFSALQEDHIFFENAGGSQLPNVVIEAMSNYLKHLYVQHGAPYDRSEMATMVADQAHQFMLRFMNGEGLGHVVLGPSTSILCQAIAQAHEPFLEDRPEIILAETGHEANLGPWARLAARGAKVRWWRVDPHSFTSSISELKALLSEKTLVVAFPHVSNILGEVVDAKLITQLAHQVGAKSVIDGVAFAPHRAIDVADLGADFYVFSNYKVFGPHSATLFGTSEAFDGLTGPNHFFIDAKDLPYKFELGGVNHEALAGIVALQSYLNYVVGKSGDVLDRKDIENAFQRISDLELPLQTRLINGLESIPGLKIIGPTEIDRPRVPTISFLLEGFPADRVTDFLRTKGFGMRHGHMYAYRLLEALAISTEPGVVRVSLVHTNTAHEIDALILALSELVVLERRSASLAG